MLKYLYVDIFLGILSYVYQERIETVYRLAEAFVELLIVEKQTGCVVTLVELCCGLLNICQHSTYLCQCGLKR